MSQSFQLQLIKKTLEELGHAPVADLLASRLKSPQNHYASHSSSSQSFQSALEDSITAGDYDSVVAVFSNLHDDFHFSQVQSTLSSEEKSVAVYLTLRSMFLEMIVRRSLELELGSTGPSHSLDFLQNDLASAYDRIDFTSSHSLPILSLLSREQESSVLVPLAMEIPTPDQLSNMIITKDVLLVDPLLLSCPRRTLTGDDCLVKIRHALSLILHPILSHSDRGSSLDSSSLINFPPNFLEKLIHNATLYSLQNSLYYLPPRNDLYITDSLPASMIIPGQADESSKDSLPIHLLHTLNDHSNEVWFTRFSPLGRFLATGSLDGTCNIYDVQNDFALLAELDANTEDQESVFVDTSYRPALDNKRGIIYFCWEPYERYIVSCCLDTVIRVWHVENITQPKRLTRSMDDEKPASLVCCFTLGESLRTWPCEFLPYNKNQTPHFIVGSPDKVLKVFTIDGTKILDFYSDADEWLTLLNENSPNRLTGNIPGSYMGDRSGSDTSVNDRLSGHTRSPSNGAADLNLQCTSAGQFNRINDFAITPNGRVLITANNDKQVFFYRIPDLFDPAATTSRIALLSLNGRLTSCSVSSNGRYMLLSIAPEELQLWDISPLDNFEKPFLKQKFLGQSQATYMVRLSFGYLSTATNKEELILSGSDDGNIYIWRLETGQLITRVRGHHGLCNAVDWNRFYKPTGHDEDYGLLWSSVGDDKLVKIWGPKTFK